MRSPSRASSAVVALLVPAALMLGGCGAGDAAEDDTAGDEATARSDPSPGPDEPTEEPEKKRDKLPTDRPGGDTTDEPEPDESGDDEGNPDADVEIEVEIEDGAVTPTGEQVPASVGDTVALVVDSDTSEELHVHSTTEYEFEVAVGDDQVFRFPVEQPGQVAVETHDTPVLVAELVVQP